MSVVPLCCDFFLQCWCVFWFIVLRGCPRPSIWTVRLGFQSWARLDFCIPGAPRSRRLVIFYWNSSLSFLRLARAVPCPRWEPQAAAVGLLGTLRCLLMAPCAQSSTNTLVTSACLMCALMVRRYSSSLGLVLTRSLLCRSPLCACASCPLSDNNGPQV